MIEKFVRGQQAIRLRDQVCGQPEQTIFSVDSLSLVIGDNGAGKTRLLDGIWNAVKGIRFPDPESDWLPHFHPGHGQLPGSVGVVYFSNAPNRVAKRKSARCIDASPSKTAPPSNEALFGYEEYVKDITAIDPHFEVRLRARPLRLLRDLLWVMLESDWSLPECSEELKREFALLGKLYQDTPNGSGARIPLRLPPASRFPDFYAQMKNVAQGMMTELLGKVSAEDQALFLLDLELERRRGHSYRAALAAAYRELATLDPKGLPANSAAREAIRALQHNARPNFAAPSLQNVAVILDVQNVQTLYWLQDSELNADLEYEWQGVSSGQWAFVTQCIQLDKALSEISHAKDMHTVLVLIDEGDAFLHLEWQRKYIYVMNKMLAKMKQVHGIPCLQVLIATHSPLLATDVPAKYVNRMAQQNVVESRPAFGAPLQALLNESFGASTIGEHAMLTLEETIGNLASGQPQPQDHYVRSIVDDPIIKRELDRLFEQLDRPHAASDPR